MFILFSVDSSVDLGNTVIVLSCSGEVVSVNVENSNISTHYRLILVAKPRRNIEIISRLERTSNKQSVMVGSGQKVSRTEPDALIVFSLSRPKGVLIGWAILCLATRGKIMEREEENNKVVEDVTANQTAGIMDCVLCNDCQYRKSSSSSRISYLVNKLIRKGISQVKKASETLPLVKAITGTTEKRNKWGRSKIVSAIAQVESTEESRTNTLEENKAQENVRVNIWAKEITNPKKIRDKKK